MRPAGLILIVFAVVVLALALMFFLGNQETGNDEIGDGAPNREPLEPDSLIGEIETAAALSKHEVLSCEDQAFADASRGPCLAGTVVEKGTGKPIARCRVALWETPAGSRGCRKIKTGRCYSDSRGRFAVPLGRIALRAGVHHALVFSSKNHALEIIDSLLVNPDEGLDGISSQLEKKGLLCLEGTGFDADDFRRLKVELVHPALQARETLWRGRGFSDAMTGRSQSTISRRSMNFSPRAYDRNALSWSSSMPVVAGMWRVTVSTGAETAVRDVYVPSGVAVTETIERQALRSPFTVLGSLTYTDGSPAEGARVFFFAEQVPALDRTESYRFVEKRQVYESCRTDGRGEFHPRNLLPGQWRIDVHLAGGGRPFLPYIIIPDNPHEPFRIDLEVARGSVSGTLCDRETHLPLDADFTEWFLLIRNAGTGRVVAEFNNHIGADFRIAAVPAGTLRLEVRGAGFENHCSEPFALANGQSLEVGSVEMTRTSRFGSLLVDLAGPRGEPLQEFVQVALFKSLGRHDHWQALLPGPGGMTQKMEERNVYRFDHLPVQELRLVVFEGAGRLPHPGLYPRRNLLEVEVQIEADELTEISLELDPRLENW